jgi:hypothetical protein
MTPVQPVRSRPARNRGRHSAPLATLLLASLASVSGHPIRGVINGTLAMAHIASPSAGSDSPIKVQWADRETNLRVVCFFAANTSTARDDDANWPRITSVGFELPGSPTGFSLLQPGDGEWELVEGMSVAIPDHETVLLMRPSSSISPSSRASTVPGGLARDRWRRWAFRRGS